MLLQKLSPQPVSLIYIKILLNDRIEFAEVQFYFLHFASPNEAPVPYALISMYSRPIQSILDDSCNTLWACSYTGLHDLRVIKLSSIISCVSMQPLPPLQVTGRLPIDPEPEGLWFVLEKSGLEDLQLTGVEEPMGNEEHQSGHLQSLGEE